MRHRLSPRASSNSRLVAALAILLAAGIFAVDTIDPFAGNVSVLYVVVPLLGAGALRRRGIVLSSLACVALTLLSFWLVHGIEASGGAVSRCLMTIAAIAVTTLLVLKNQSTSTDLSEKAQLLDLTHDAIFVRGMDDLVRSGNAAAAESWWRKHLDEVNKHYLARPMAKTVVAAMKKYGLVLADNGSPWYFQGEQNAHWPDRLISDLKTIPASAFEAVDTSSLKVSDDSAQVR